MSHRLLQIGTGVVSGLAVAMVVLFLTPGPPGTQEWAGASPPPAPYPAPLLELEGLDGNRVSLSEFRGWTTIVFFGYTHCPDICPATLLNLSRAMEELGPRGDRVRIVFVTVDPERDTVERMESWLTNFHPGIIGLRGSEAEIREQASRWGVHMAVATSHDGHGAQSGSEHRGGAQDEGQTPETENPHDGHGGPDTNLPAEVLDLVPPGAPGAYGVDHSARSFVVDRSGRIVLFLAPFQGGEAMAADLRRVIR